MEKSMFMKALQSTAQAIVADGKGLLAADETVSTLSRRLVARGIESTPDSRRCYREMLFSTKHVGECISGVILHEETIRQCSSTGVAFPKLLGQRGMLAGIKVDRGANPLAGSTGEHITDGLDGLRDRLKEYAALGARFAKWRAVIVVSDVRPTALCLRDNAYALARYAAICQEQGLVPIVEAEVMTDGTHTIERCEDVTGAVLREIFAALLERKVMLEGILLKPNMVVPGSMSPQVVSSQAIAAATLRCLRRFVPAAVPGITFLSGGQDPFEATAHLNAIAQETGPKPWQLTFSFGRALQDEALRAWGGWPENVGAGQLAFLHRARCLSSAAAGSYSAAMEEQPAVA
jgi:fructose-bisphosphate aldolase class I